ncbi:MAG: hypothetical protein WCN95_14065 [bacterium]
MPTAIRLWRVEDEQLSPIPQQKLDLEERIENWMCQDITLVSNDLIVMGQQVPTAYGGFIDLLAIDPVGNLVILELKRDKTPRDIVAQVLDYASWVEKLTHDDILATANAFLKPKTLEQAFRDKFGAELPDVLNERHRMYVVASSLDSATERIVKYLSESHNVDINVATFSYFKTPQGEILGRSLLLDDEQVQVRAEATSKRQPPRTWEELRSFAEQRGVADLYDKALDALRPFFDGSNRTRSNVAFNGIMGEEKSRTALLGIYPEASSKEAGLAIHIYVVRFSEYFASSEKDVRNVIGEPNGKADTWDPKSTFFFDDNRLNNLVALLQKAKKKPVPNH